MRLLRGVFRYIDGEIFAVKLPCNENGDYLCEEPISLRGKPSLTHSEEWKKLPKSVTWGKAYNHYPRGRVEIKNGKATIYLNPDILTDGIIERIKTEFQLDALLSVKAVADGSFHYRYKE